MPDPPPFRFSGKVLVRCRLIVDRTNAMKSKLNRRDYSNGLWTIMQHGARRDCNETIKESFRCQQRGRRLTSKKRLEIGNPWSGLGSAWDEPQTGDEGRTGETVAYGTRGEDDEKREAWKQRVRI